MGLSGYFLDTYGMHEILRGNPDYKRFTTEVALMTCKLNLMELYYTVMTKHGERAAETSHQAFRDYCISVPDETMKRAMHFRAKNKKANLSYADCIGYTLAIERGVKFLTGDKEFEDLPNVEYVK